MKNTLYSMLSAVAITALALLPAACATRQSAETEEQPVAETPAVQETQEGAPEEVRANIQLEDIVEWDQEEETGLEIPDSLIFTVKVENAGPRGRIQARRERSTDSVQSNGHPDGQGGVPRGCRQHIEDIRHNSPRGHMRDEILGGGVPAQIDRARGEGVRRHAVCDPGRSSGPGRNHRERSLDRTTELPRYVGAHLCVRLFRRGGHAGPPLRTYTPCMPYFQFVDAETGW
jgi:hypothetical protein